MNQKFYKSDSDFQKFYLSLKQIPCPHCNIIECLILHGHLYGYDDQYLNKRIIRGHRIFCSNRNQRKGCGRSFSILAADILKNFRIKASSLWLFLKKLTTIDIKFQAMKASNLIYSNSTIYRLWNKFSESQPFIRSHIFRYSKLPKTFQSKKPIVQTILHLKHFFKTHHCPISAFQYYFQTSFLA